MDFTGFDISAAPAQLETGSVYEATLTAIEPFTYTDPQTNEERQLFEWKFVVDDAKLGVVEVSGTTTSATGPKSKAFRWLTALIGASAITPGAHIGLSDLVGREGLITIGENKNGYSKVDDITARPKG